MSVSLRWSGEGVEKVQCPFCNLALREVFEREVEFDVCDSCHGVWLDHGELELFSNGKDFVPHPHASEDLSYLRCPRCDTQRFASVHMEEGPLARCGDCQGFFVEGATIERVTATRRRPRGGAEGLSEVADDALTAWMYYDLFAGLFGGAWR